MTDEKKNDTPQAESDNAFAGGVGEALPGEAEQTDDAAPAEDGTQGENVSSDDAPVDQEHPDTKLAAERLGDLQRVQAEYVNYRNRVERDRAREKEATVGSVVESLIPVLDDIELARQHGDLAEGPMSKIADKIEATLARFNVVRFGEANEAFDPTVHEALMHIEAEAPEGVEGTFVVQVLQPGYKVGERVVRPARVSVAG